MRKTKVLEFINASEKVSVRELADKFDVSVETMRRDLRKLDEQGEIRRIHGSVMNIKASSTDVGRPFSERSKDNLKVKESLVKKALAQIKEHMVIGLDASSSSWCLSQQMPNINCTVITNSLKNILALERKSNIRVICSGGRYSAKYGSFYGSVAINSLSNMSADVSFISCVGFDEESGVWDSNEYNYQIKQTLMAISKEVVLIADKSKYGKKSLFKVCGINSLTNVITDR
ncbi:L-fucose operon activator [Vibrio sp. MACH09]|uniref:DeoR/GlpR family DNA-binding transcription regulator n=1 Tax=Vibrio sp. MACH09 TaxID=3025122 RepID=UPI002791BD86|nr:DeoR/GlpR family DNA-binding transcription regulator [Vibrio sp. MACH09]GLO60642.1 L-fucose operon activator [Vibrio sp. MACH09]